MADTKEHATLSASSAHRWLHCTPSARFEENFPEKTSVYAEEGRLAHSICELKALKKFTTKVKPKEYTAKLEELKKDPLYNSEMDKTSDIYIDYLVELAMTYNQSPVVNVEIRVDFSNYVPEGFGTCDCVMIGGDTLNIIDYKHGKGVLVSAENNPQIRLYAIGALNYYAPLYGGMIKKVKMSIIQPRISSEASTEELTAEELLAWGEEIKKTAKEAFNGKGNFKQGNWCNFCAGKAVCAERAKENLQLEKYINTPVNMLTPEQIGELLKRAKPLVEWAKSLEDYALKSILDGQLIPGWKAVEGRSIRVFSDQDKAIEKIREAGYDEALLYERKAKTLSELEKMIGKKEFESIVGEYIVKPLGKPTLVTETDKRQAYKVETAKSDFADIVKQ